MNYVLKFRHLRSVITAQCKQRLKERFIQYLYISVLYIVSRCLPCENGVTAYKVEMSNFQKPSA